MMPDRPSDTIRTMPAHVCSWRERWFAGLTWKTFALIAMVCALNSARRAGQEMWDFQWLVRFAVTFFLALVALLPPTLAIVATHNLAPPASRWRYPALALAILVSSAAGTA